MQPTWRDAGSKPLKSSNLKMVPRSSARPLRSPEATCLGETGKTLTQTEAGGTTHSPTLPSSRQRRLPWSKGNFSLLFRSAPVSHHSSRPPHRQLRNPGSWFLFKSSKSNWIQHSRKQDKFREDLRSVSRGRRALAPICCAKLPAFRGCKCSQIFVSEKSNVGWDLSHFHFPERCAAITHHIFGLFVVCFLSL